MAIINYSDQLKYTGKGYIDAKMTPVETVDDLKKIPITQRFEGFTVTVLNDGKPQDYWLVGGVANKYWVPKTVVIEDYETAIKNIQERLTNLYNTGTGNTESINEINEKLFDVDDQTIGSSDNKIHVKILEHDENMLKNSYNGENGLFVSIPVFCEDE